MSVPSSRSRASSETAGRGRLAGGDPAPRAADTAGPAGAEEAAPAGVRAPARAPTPAMTPVGRLWLQVAFSLSLVALALLVLYLIRDVAGAFILGALLAFLILPLVDRMAAGGVPRALGILIAYGAIALVVWLLISALVPLFNEEINSLVAQAPVLAGLAQNQLSQLQHGNQLVIFGYSLDLTLVTDQIIANARSFLLGQFPNAVGLGLTAITTFLQMLLLLVVSFLVAMNAHSISALFRLMVPPDFRSDFDQIWADTKRMLYAYMRGQLVVAALIGAFTTVAVTVLGLKYPLALGLLAAVSSLIPYIGPYIGAVPAVLIALAAGPYQALIVAVSYVVISNVIFNFVSPRVVGSAVRLPSLVVIVAFLAGFSMGGILGMFIAVPVAAFIRIVYAHVHPRLFSPAPAGAPRPAHPGPEEPRL